MSNKNTEGDTIALLPPVGGFLFLREGVTRKDDTLPQRMLKEPLPKAGIPPIEDMLNQYYIARNWEKTKGIPKKKNYMN